MTGTMPTGIREKEGSYEQIRALRNDTELMRAIERGVEARHNGERFHWNEVKAELGIR